MKLRNALLTFFLLFPICMFAGITGRYKVSGFDPLTNQKYSGIVLIQKNNNIFTASWIFDNGGTDKGTGVQRGNCVSFVFNESPGNTFGTQLYKIEGHTLKGPWVRFGSDARGFEKIVKLHD